MTPQRRGLLATFLGFGLVLVLAVAVVLATSLTLGKVSGPRDNGSGTATLVTVSGDLWDGPDTPFSPAKAYWDMPGSPAPIYEIATSGTTAVSNAGVFGFQVEVPWYDNESNPVRPGSHVISICATHGSIAAITECVSHGFTVLKGTAVLSKASGRQGSALTISGSRWVPEPVDEAIRITWAPNGANLDMVGDQFGPSTWSQTFNVPSLPAGTYPIRICNVSNFDGSCSESIVKQFTILDPILNLSKSSGATGSPFDYSGDIFFPSRPVKIWFGPAGDMPGDPLVHEIGPGGATTNADGHFGKFTYAPSEGPGDYTVTVCTLSARGPCNTFDIATKPYTITAPATPSPTPKPTASPSPTPKPTASPTQSPTPTHSPTPIATAIATATPTASPTASPTATPTASPSATPLATPTPSLAPTVAPVSAPPTTAPTATPDPTPKPTVAPTTPSPSPTQAAVVTWPEHLHSPGQTAGGGGIDLGTLGGMSLLALLIAFLVPFPGTLFNKTVEANYGEIMGWIAGLKRRWTSLVDGIAKGPLGPVRRWIARLLAGRFGVWIFLGLSAVVYGFLSPTFGLDMSSLALFLGLFVGLAFITAAFDLPLRLYHGRTSKAHDRGVLRALWWTLLVAVICVVVSRLMNFQPGYLYGLVVSIVFVTEISRRDEGVGVWLASFWLIVLSFVAWMLLAFVRQGAFDPWLSLFLQTMLATFVVAGIETLAVGLLPLRFLPGHPLYQWRRGMWFVLFALAVMGYLLILVDPANGYLSDDSRTPMIIGVILLITFGVVSLGTWAYFRYRPARPSGDVQGELPAG